MIGVIMAGSIPAIWLYMLIARHGFWLTRERDDRNQPADPATWPRVTAVVPARDEAAVIVPAIQSLFAQDYPGEFGVILIDDGSVDGTASLARAAATDPARLTICSGAPLPAGWTGKVWALSQGIETAGTPDYLWLTDADIVHAPDTLRRLVARAIGDDRVLVSLMARLRCESMAERALVPAFIFFFKLLYPFGAVNRRRRGRGAAAGGCMLVDAAALARAGGIRQIRGALIDDCAFGALLKRQGPVWLGLTDRVRSIRPYNDAASIGAMIARSAYTQLGYSPLALIGTLLGLGLTYVAPPLMALLSHGLVRIAGLSAWLLMAIAFQPVLRFYRRSPLWGIGMPAIATFYAGCTLLSGWQHHRRRGGQWKGRVQARARP
jgi:hopene-associated glycosyltransferase HpnB